MKIKELLLFENIQNKVFLHGGPSPDQLVGGHFKRHARKGHDMGALFFIEESDAGYKYALGYAIARGTDTGIYRVKITLPENKIFDFTNPKHRDIVKSNLTDQEFEYWDNTKGKSGHIDWAVIDEEIIEEMGFEGAYIHERNEGQIKNASDIVSVAIFDPKYIEIIDFTHKRELLKKGKY